MSLASLWIAPVVRAIVVSCLQIAPLNSQPTLPQVDFKERFRKFEGCFVLREITDQMKNKENAETPTAKAASSENATNSNGWTLRYNEKRCAKQFSPCSTFKIFNALAGLDCGVLKGPDDLQHWDKTPQPFPNWEKDHTLQTAMTNSVVWYFREVARRIGEKKMKQYIEKCGYGNQDISSGIDRFWLEESMKISADQQLEFLHQLYTNQLPFEQKTMETVRTLIVVDKGDDWVLSGKTGSGMSNGKKHLGWFVGHIETQGRQYVFALNITGDGAWGPGARELTKGLLGDLGLVPTGNKNSPVAAAGRAE